MAVAALAGLLYRPHRARNRLGLATRLHRLTNQSARPAANPAAAPAPASAQPYLGLVLAEARLIGSGRLMQLLAVCAGLAGVAGLAAPLLWLAFALSSHAGRAESRGLRTLTLAARIGPWTRRTAFVMAGTGWSVLLAIPFALATSDPAALLLAGGIGAIASAAAISLAALSGSGFAPRIVLLIAWYVYTAS